MTMPDQNSDLSALAALAAQVPEERRRLLEGQLPVADNPRFSRGLAAGLACALRLVVEQQVEEAARPLQEMAAVAAARALEEQRQYAELRQQMMSPAAREELEAEIERIKRGEVKLIPMEEVLREVEEIVRRGNNDSPGS
jgi:hypothetical protein